VSYRARTPGHLRDGWETRGEMDWHGTVGFREYGALAPYYRPVKNVFRRSRRVREP